MSEPIFFDSAAAWRHWLATYHAGAAEVSVGFWKRRIGRPSLSWPQSVDEALCYGWVDGVRHRIDEDAYRIRFTPRRPGSVWSQVNLKRFAELQAEGRVTPAGQAAFDAGKLDGPNYSFERETASFGAELLALFQSDPRAWRHWEASPPGYRKLCTHWVTSAKRPETQARRLAQVMDAAAHGRRIDFMAPGSKRMS